METGHLFLMQKKINKIHKINVTDKPLDKLPKNFLLKMDKFFEYDVNLVSQFVKKDLSKWRVLE